MTELHRPPEEVVRVLLVSTHDWFASAFQAVLEPEGFVFAHVRSARHALRHVQQSVPDIVIVSERLPDLDAPGLIRTLRSSGLPGRVPVLVYSPNFWHEDEQAAAVAAGAWDIIREPLRPAILVAKLRRLLSIGELVAEDAIENGDVHADALPELAGLTTSIRRIEATARRETVPLSCVVLGPTRPAEGVEVGRQRAAAAALCSENLRLSDLFGWVDETDIGVLAYNTTAEGVLSMVRRLNERVSALESAVTLRPLSAGVVELSATEPAAPEDPPHASRIASLSRLAAAQAALREARAGGGGIRIGRPA